MNTDGKMMLKAEDISPALREGLALLPGCRDRAGRAMIVFPSKEQSCSGDQVQNVLFYLHTVTADDAKEKGFTVVIDMRGKQTWSNVKLMLKAISAICETTTIHIVFIIKPDKFWEKQKAQLATGTWSFDVQMISAEQLVKHLDASQLPKELGGTYPYNHDDWVETRLELERWIWRISEVMRGLETHRRQIENLELPSDLNQAQASIQTHAATKNAILAIPIEKIQQEANMITGRINKPATGIKNLDLVAVLPHINNLNNSLLDLKNNVFKLCDKRRSELEEIHQLKLYEYEVIEMMEWIRSHSRMLLDRMGDIGSSEAETAARLKEFEEFETAAGSSKVTVDQVTSNAARLVSNGTPQHKTRVERSAVRMGEDWDRFQNLLRRRRLILTTAMAFFRCSGQYFARLPTWSKQPGIEPTTVNTSNSTALEEAISNHQLFWNDVEDIYAEAFSQGTQLTQDLKAADAGDVQGTAKELLHKLARAQKQLHTTWDMRKKQLHSMLALTAFQTDTQRVIEWLNEHGDTYLQKNTKIGDNVEQASILQKNHVQFKRIAQNTYANASKLVEARNMIIDNGAAEAEQERMQSLLQQLDNRLQQFTIKLDARYTLLNLSVLFHTHYNELMKWYADLERKYDRRISIDVDECENAKEQWVLESDATAQAFTTTINEGTQLVEGLRSNQDLLGVNYQSAIALINQKLTQIDQTHRQMSERWAPQRTHLHIALMMSLFIRDTTEVLMQISNWEEDMRGMVDSPTFHENAERVQPYHLDNTDKVKTTIRNIHRQAKELLQSLHGNNLRDLKTRSGQLVEDLIHQNTRELQGREQQVMIVASQTAAKIEGAKKLTMLQALAQLVVEDFEHLEKKLNTSGSIPRSLEEANVAWGRFDGFRKTMESHDFTASEAFKKFYNLSNELIKEGVVDRSLIVELNEFVTGNRRRLIGLTDELGKLLKGAIGCYKTHNQGVNPILDQLEREYAVSPTSDYCRDFPSSVAEDRANHLSQQLSKLNEYKDRFLKGCSYAHKTSELFLKYIQRANVPAQDRQHHEDRINKMKAALRERQSKILELWNRKKKHLDRCQHFVLLEASCEQITTWLSGEGEAKLQMFTRHLQNMKPSQASDILEDFSKFKSSVKEKREIVKDMLRVATAIRAEAVEHAADITNCMTLAKQKFEAFSKRVSECETQLRGDKQSVVRDELSLDRHSDNSVEERIERERADKVENEQLRKIREPMRELLKTEKDYIEDLKRCVDIYIKDFDSAAAGLPAGLRGRRKDIFGNIEKIYEFHAEKFIHELTKYENDPEAVGCSFNVWVDYLNELYTDYSVNKHTYSYVLDLPEAIQYFRTVQEKHKLEMNNTLLSLLIKPIQRITRYELLMGQLLKALEKERTNSDELREAYEIVRSVPRKANDIITLNYLDKDKLGVLGPFVMQDTLTVWEPRTLFKKGKDRQVFLFELAIVFAKRLETPSKSPRFIAKGKPVPLNEVSVVEHVEGDVCRFGLRVGTVSSNDNRTDVRAKDENAKLSWVRKIRELTQGLLPAGLGGSLDSASMASTSSLSAARSISTRSTVSASSGDRLSREVDGLSLDGAPNRLSVQSQDSVEEEYQPSLESPAE